MRFPIHRVALAAAAILIPFSVAPTFLGAQTRSRADEKRETEARIERLPDGMSVVFGSSTRPVLGVKLAASSRSDVDGVRIDEVQADGPAARAGIKAGDVITSINGVSLRVSEADADDPALQGIAQRRLTRTLGKTKAGDNVDLRVRSGGSERNVTVKTVTASELNTSSRSSVFSKTSPTSVGSTNESRGVIGLSIGGTGNSRDTLGLFINSVVTDGPADRAGVVEGERIAAVNGVDVRVPREDLEDMSAMSARANRFIREVQKVAPGGNVTLRVYSGGRYRDVSVRTVRSSDLPRQGFSMSIGDGSMVFSLPRTPNALNGATVIPRGTILSPTTPGRVYFDGDRLQIDREAIERSMNELRLKLQDMGREMRIETIPRTTVPKVTVPQGNRTLLRAAPRRISTSI